MDFEQVKNIYILKFEKKWVAEILGNFRLGQM